MLVIFHAQIGVAVQVDVNRVSVAITAVVPFINDPIAINPDPNAIISAGGEAIKPAITIIITIAKIATTLLLLLPRSVWRMTSS